MNNSAETLNSYRHLPPALDVSFAASLKIPPVVVFCRGWGGKVYLLRVVHASAALFSGPGINPRGSGRSLYQNVTGVGSPLFTAENFGMVREVMGLPGFIAALRRRRNVHFAPTDGVVRVAKKFLFGGSESRKGVTARSS